MLLVASATGTFAGQYFQDFTAFSAGATNFSDGSTLTSTALGTVAAVQDATLKELQLTETGVANTRSAFLLPDLDPGTPVYAFSAKWNSQVYGNFPSAGEGFSFTFGAVRSLSLTNSSYNQESGYGTGLCFSVQTDATNNPGFYLCANGATIASQTNNPTTQWGTFNGTRHFFEVDWDLAGGLNVRVDGQTVFTNVVTTNYVSQAGDSFAWAARCSALSEEVRLDNLVVVTGGKLVAASVGAPYFFTSAYTPSYPVTNAFDGNPATAWVATNASATVIGGTLASTQTVNVYVVNKGTLPGAAAGPIPAGAVSPLLCQMQGSADGTNWSGFATNTVRFFANQESRAFLVSGSTPYKNWQLNILLNAAGNSAGYGTGLGELQLYALQPVPYAAPTLTNSAAASSVLPQIDFTAAIDAHGLDTMVVMELGTNTSYGTSVTNFIAAGNTNGLTAFSGFVPVDFERATALHGRIRVSNAAGAVSSADLTFASEGFALRLSGRLNNMTALGPMGDNVAWMDADNDGHLDLWVMGGAFLSAGAANAVLFYNPNTSGITNWAVQPVTPGAGYLGCILLGDVNNDNRPDALVAGSTGTQTSGVYGSAHGAATVYLGADRRGQIGFGWFGSVGYQLAGASIDSSNDTPLFGETRGAIRDFDHDGKQDLLLTGWKESSNASFSRMFHNVFAGTTAKSNLVGGVTSITPMGWSDLNDPLFQLGSFFISAGHLTGDGFPDVYAYGNLLNYSFTNQNPTSGWGLYRNNGELDFNVVQAGPSVDSVNFDYGGASSVWADFNGDGFEDLLVCEGTPYNSRTQILLNDGAGHLTNSSIVLPQLNAGSVAAGDLFNHGRNDIVISGWQLLGYNLGLRHSQIFVLRNDGNGVFTPVDFGLYATATRGGMGFALADYDDDGRLDLAVIGGGVTSLTIDSTSLYRNKMNIPTNHPPTAPGGLSTTVGAGTVTFHWNTATDDLTPTNLLTYNLRVGTNTLGTQTVSPIANVTNGWRKIAAPGSLGHCFNTLYRFPPGTYYWSVQAIDGIFAGGAWATEGTFTITQPEIPILDIARATNQNAVKWPARFPDYTMQQKSS
ncbi:MAG: hypothetical protein RL616_2244, partial [Verrucomicrobiota bacterium]